MTGTGGPLPPQVQGLQGGASQVTRSPVPGASERASPGDGQGWQTRLPRTSRGGVPGGGKRLPWGEGSSTAWKAGLAGTRFLRHRRWGAGVTVVMGGVHRQSWCRPVAMSQGHCLLSLTSSEGAQVLQGGVLGWWSLCRSKENPGAFGEQTCKASAGIGEEAVPAELTAASAVGGTG